MTDQTPLPGADKLPDKYNTQMAQDFQRMFERGFGSDLTIKCDGKQWKVHTSVLAARSAYFEKLLSRDWKETTRGVVEIEEDSSDAINALLQYIYGYNYDAGPEPGNDDKFGWTRRCGFHVEVCIVADKYAVKGLGLQARERLVGAAEHVL